MISRKTTLLIASIISDGFTHKQKQYYGMHNQNYEYVYKVNGQELKDFLFEYGARGFTINKIAESFYNKQDLKNNILNMHTGMLYNSQKYKQFEVYGQEDLKAIITGIFEKNIESIRHTELENFLRIDGYIYENGKLYQINTDIDSKTSLIFIKYKQLNFDKLEEFKTFNNDMNEHFENSKWSDSIHNGRKLYEIVLMECSKYYTKNIIKDNKILGNEKPVEIREYLEKNNFFSEDEANIIRYYYKYISNIGSHPNLALMEQADFSRVMTINIILYALNRIETFKQ